MTLVAGGALTAALLPDERRGEGLALVGLVSGIPSLPALPLGTFHTRLLTPGAALSVTGMAAMATTQLDALALGGAATFGAGFGVLQNTIVTLMYDRVPAPAHSSVSAIRNAGYDLGMAAGAIGPGCWSPRSASPLPSCSPQRSWRPR